MPSNGTPETCCNARVRHDGHDPQNREKIDPGEWGGPGYCKAPAGHKTGHLGDGRCHLHGGTDNGRPVEHGLYSQRREELREDLKGTIEEAEGIDTPGSMWAEVAVLRALLSEFLDRMDGVDTDAIKGATKLQKEIRRTVDTLHQMRHRDAPSEEEIQRLVTGFASIIQTYVPDEKRADAIDELRAVANGGRRNRIEGGGAEA